MTGSIEHVMDTAFWVASDRSLEGERPDALFRDPLAAVLAGEKGRRIAESMPNHRAMVFVVALRTTAIDRLIASAIERGADTVLNLGAGLDTRPYRWAPVTRPECRQRRIAATGQLALGRGRLPERD
jgi:O-methyltransferase involved in polyketide biosynthesis